MSSSNQRIRSNTYDSLQNMMLERQQAGGENTAGMARPPGTTGENPFDQMLASRGENKAGMTGNPMSQTDAANVDNSFLSDISSQTGGMNPEEEMEGPEGIDMGPGRATRGPRRKR